MGISLKKVEIESFTKSFLLFFLSLASVMLFLTYQTYKSKLNSLEDSLYAQMKIASLSPKETLFSKKVIPKTKDILLDTFYTDKDELLVFFASNDSNKSLIKISYPIKSFNHDEELTFKQSRTRFLKSLVIIFFLSIIFSLYALNPYKRYLKLTDEFIKDILHDFNTPISTIRLNISILKSKFQNKNLQRIENGIDTILNLQNNLKEYLEDDIKKSEKFEIKKTVEHRVSYIQGIYPHIKFDIRVKNKIIYCYKDGFIRILDNLLSNACKYNKKNGSVTIILRDDRILKIIDTGTGIKKPKKIFDRFYKETSRGLGIGLHIVKKLSKKIEIDIEVNSTLGKGTTFKLDLSKLILN